MLLFMNTRRKDDLKLLLRSRGVKNTDTVEMSAVSVMGFSLRYIEGGTEKSVNIRFESVPKSPKVCAAQARTQASAICAWV